MTCLSLLVADLVALLDDNLRETFEERAAIVEFDGKQPRELAECLALLDVVRRNRGALLGVYLLQVDGRYLLTTEPGTARQSPVQLADVVRDAFGGTAQLTAGNLPSYMEG